MQLQKRPVSKLNRAGPMLYLIDGTGEAEDDLYQRDMRNGFLRRMETEYAGIYYRGPTTMNWTISTGSIVKSVVKAILEDERLGREDLYLAGHSRGGYAVLCVAEELAKVKPVRAMFLFDAVDRTPGPFARTLPKTIKKAYHATRDPILGSYVDRSVVDRAIAAFIHAYGRDGTAYVDSITPPPNGKCTKEWEAMRRLQEEDLKFRWAVRARYVVFPVWFRLKYNCIPVSVDFENCLGLEPKTNNPRYEFSTFMGTHGAIGGAPINDPKAGRLIAGDAAAMASVWAWMEPRIEKEGLKKKGSFVVKRDSVDLPLVFGGVRSERLPTPVK
jgi:pimeloyl-ACP methyl ester carboxylesterase